MVQRRGGARFLLEPPVQVRIGGESCGENFEGDVASEARIARAIDLAHAAGTDQGNDFIVIDARPGRKGHPPRLYSVAIASPGRCQVTIVSLHLIAGMIPAEPARASLPYHRGFALRASRRQSPCP